MNAKGNDVAQCTELWSKALSDDKVAQQAVDAASAAVDAATKALDVAEHTESSKLSDLQSAIDDASDAEQKASQAYSEDLLACPSVDTAEQAAGHEKLLRRALRAHSETIDALLQSHQL
eukprot:COSAG05_NODE_1213_length_5492_cov_12.157983_6_plen_119_part_00